MTAEPPGYDEVVLTPPDGSRPCNSRACARAGTLAEVIVTYGVLNDPAAGYHAGGALRRESWGVSVPMSAACRDSSRLVAVKYRPGLVVIDATGSAPAAAKLSGGAGVTDCPGPAPGAPPAADDAGRWREASRLRREHPRWVVIWLAPLAQFRAYARLPGTRRDTALTARTPADMADQISHAEQAAPKHSLTGHGIAKLWKISLAIS